MERGVWPVAVVGAGAAGLLAAIFAARRGARVLCLETRPVPGAKIRVSGGGRCNILPSAVELGGFHTGSSRNSLRNILRSWPLSEVRAFFESELSLPLKVEPTGKLFPASDRSRDVVEALLGECRRAGVTLLGGHCVESVEARERRLFGLASRKGESFKSRRVILTTGGLSLPRTGSDGGGLLMARSLGHSLRETHPALVPLRSADPAWTDLAGISLRTRLCAVREGKVLEEREGDFLFTHRGFSGPVLLDVSRHFTEPQSGKTLLLASWGGSHAPDWEVLLLGQGRRSVSALLGENLPRRLVERLLVLAEIPECRTASEFPREERKRLLEVLTACPLPVTGSEGYAVAEVTAGGIPLEEVSPSTLESRIVPGLHLAGEILDADGPIGGHNFLWAWVTGRQAGLGAGAESG